MFEDADYDFDDEICDTIPQTLSPGQIAAIVLTILAAVALVAMPIIVSFVR